MRKKNKRTPGIEEAHPFRGMSRIHPYAAGVDIGAIEIVACVAGHENTQIVKAFGNYTVDLHALAQWLKSYHIRTVAMESTGVYWIPLFEELERQGFECLLISSRSLRRVAGRKSDISDAQWIQTLHTYGLLEGSFRPQGELVSLRTLLRHRSQLVEHRSPHVQHMQKALQQMNVLLHQVVSDITGVTGMAIIQAILAGERDPKVLAQFRDKRCKNSAEVIAQSLVGNYREEHLFALQQAVTLYEVYQAQIAACDEQIEQYLLKTVGVAHYAFESYHAARFNVQHHFLLGGAVRDVLGRADNEFEVRGFVDDDRHKKGGSVNGVKVLGTTEDLPRLVEEMQISQVILALDEDRLLAAIRPAGLYNTKARNIRRLCAALIEEHFGAVPTTREGLMRLPGVGRKCADIVLRFTYGQPVCPVDTHVHRVANRLGLAYGKTEAQTARALEPRIPDWARMDSHIRLIRFGRRVCRAPRPRCRASSARRGSPRSTAASGPPAPA